MTARRGGAGRIGSRDAAGAIGWTEDARPLAPGTSAALVRSLLNEYVAPRLAAGAMQLVTSGSGEAAPGVDGDASERLPSRYVFPRHAHQSYEVCWVIDGRCVLWLAGRSILLNPQRACVIKPGELHHVLPTSKLEPFRTLWCLATPRGVVLDEGTFAQGQRLTVGHFVRLSAPATPQLAAAAREVDEGRPQHDLFARLRLLEVAALVLRAIDEPAGGMSVCARPAGEQGTTLLVHRLMEHIQGSHEAGVTLGRLAAYVGLSPNYATTLFRVHTGRTLMAYVNEVRHRHATALLRDTDLGVAAVAREVGYNDPFYFDRVFCQREGCPPLAYRRLYRAPPAPSAPPVPE